MMAPRTKELEQLFKDGEEAVFWDSTDDLVSKVKYYLANETERKIIATAGRAKLLHGGFDEYAQAHKIVNLYESYFFVNAANLK